MDDLELVTRLGRRVTAGWLARSAGRWGAPGGPRPGSVPVTIEIVREPDLESVPDDVPRRPERPGSADR